MIPSEVCLMNLCIPTTLFYLLGFLVSIIIGIIMRLFSLKGDIEKEIKNTLNSDKNITER